MRGLDTSGWRHLGRATARRRRFWVRDSAVLGCALFVLVGLLPRGAAAEPYDQGRVRVSVSGGMANAFGERYFALQAGAGYFVLKGLEAGLDLEQWLGPGPTLTKLSPEVRYVLHFVPVVKPYVGGFYKHWFVGDALPDVDTVGGRLGAFVAAFGGHGVLGGGAVFEQVVSACTEDCLLIYPELTVFFSF